LQLATSKTENNHNDNNPKCTMKQTSHIPAANVYSNIHRTNRSFKRRRVRENAEHENDDDSDNNNSIRSSTIPTSLLPLSSIAILGDSTVSLTMAFLLLLIAIIFQRYTSVMTQQQSDIITHDETTSNFKNHRSRPNSATATASSQPALLLKEFTTYESLGPLPDEIVSEQKNKNDFDSPKIYHVTDPHMITPEMIQEYHRDGVICIRGLISKTLSQRLDDETKFLFMSTEEGKEMNKDMTKEEGKEMYKDTADHRKHRRGGTQFHTVLHSALFRPMYNTTTRIHSKNSSNESSDRQPSALMEVALWSNVSMVAASLLQLPSLSSPSSTRMDNETLRVIRDIFLAKDDDPYVCGWHVDDFGFWPAMPRKSSSSLSLEGINAWIALDDMLLTEETGGFALAVQSHTAKWNYTAYNITGAPTTQNFPHQTGGYHNVSHMFQERVGYGTCNIERTAPHIHQRLEEMKRIYPVRKGDVIFHTRYLFHRTVPISSSKRKGDQDRKVFRRYSIRYGMGSTTIIPPGYGTELSVLYDSKNGGLSADRICSKDQIPWYPQAYPHMEGIVQDIFWKGYTSMLQHHIPIAEQRLQLRKQEMRPYLRQLAHEQSSRKKNL
jgi:Phytanoyl-CoA dioxygenase (PhyH)